MKYKFVCALIRVVCYAYDGGTMYDELFNIIVFNKLHRCLLVVSTIGKI